MKQWNHLFVSNWRIGIIPILVLLLFHPALTNFFTHDDFFHFKISQANSVGDFFSFFNLLKGPDNWGYYRPLTTQVWYFFGTHFLGKNAIVMHGVVMLLFLYLCSLVYKLLLYLLNHKTLAAFLTLLYATSSTHFAHLYSVANQELGLALASVGALICWYHWIVEDRENTQMPSGVIPSPFRGGLGWGSWLLFTNLCFIAALMSKETAVVIPGLMTAMYVYLKYQTRIQVQFNKFMLAFLPTVFLLSLYLYLHLFHYGLVEGDSYVWQLSPRVALNSLAWYGLWSLGLPDMLVDFVGPGFRFNPNLFQFWGKEMTIIFGLFSLQLGSLFILWLKRPFPWNRQAVSTFLLGVSFFILPLLPVIFLPWHKYPTYLTLPFIGVLLLLSPIFKNYLEHVENRNWKIEIKKPTRSISNFQFPTSHIFHYGPIVVFCLAFLVLSKLTLDLNRRTSWYSQGGETSKRVYEYFNKLNLGQEEPVRVYFYDQPRDADLPWKPSQQLQITLSNQNFFDVFFEGKIQAQYVETEPIQLESNEVKLPARPFLGY